MAYTQIANFDVRDYFIFTIREQRIGSQYCVLL
jgi:hypothetical protein